MRVNAWRELGEHCTDTLDKGSRVVVTGALVTETWEKDGQQRSAVKIVADDVGASLLFATARIMKAIRSNGAPPPTDPWTGEAATTRTRPAVTDDEPPF